MRPQSRWTRGLNALGYVPMAMVALGFAIVWVAERLQAADPGLASAVAGLGFLLGVIGFPLLLVWVVAFVVFRVFRGLGTVTGAVAKAPAPAPPSASRVGGSTWLVRLADRDVVVYEVAATTWEWSSQPSWLACEGKWIHVKWSWRRTRSEEFDIAGHRAHLEGSDGLRQRVRLVVEGASVTRLPQGDGHGREGSPGRAGRGDILSPS